MQTSARARRVSSSGSSSSPRLRRLHTGARGRAPARARRAGSPGRPVPGLGGEWWLFACSVPYFGFSPVAAAIRRSERPCEWRSRMLASCSGVIGGRATQQGFYRRGLLLTVFYANPGWDVQSPEGDNPLAKWGALSPGVVTLIGSRFRRSGPAVTMPPRRRPRGVRRASVPVGKSPDLSL